MTLTGSEPPATSEDTLGQNPNRLVRYAPAAADAPTLRNRRLVVTWGRRMKGTPRGRQGLWPWERRRGATPTLDLSLSLRIGRASNLCTAFGPADSGKNREV